VGAGDGAGVGPGVGVGSCAAGTAEPRDGEAD